VWHERHLPSPRVHVRPFCLKNAPPPSPAAERFYPTAENAAACPIRSFRLTLLSLLVPLVVSVLIYRDATRRSSRHALAWAVGAFLGSLVVWVLYYVVRDEVGTRSA
jgi:hypothetical protein